MNWSVASWHINCWIWLIKWQNWK